MHMVSDIEQISGKGHCLEVSANAMPTKMREDDPEERNNLENIEQDVTDLVVYYESMKRKLIY